MGGGESEKITGEKYEKYQKNGENIRKMEKISEKLKKYQKYLKNWGFSSREVLPHLKFPYRKKNWGIQTAVESIQCSQFTIVDLILMQ